MSVSTKGLTKLQYAAMISSAEKIMGERLHEGDIEAFRRYEDDLHGPGCHVMITLDAGFKRCGAALVRRGLVWRTEVDGGTYTDFDLTAKGARMAEAVWREVGCPTTAQDFEDAYDRHWDRPTRAELAEAERLVEAQRQAEQDRLAPRYMVDHDGGEEEGLLQRDAEEQMLAAIKDDYSNSRWGKVLDADGNEVPVRITLTLALEG